MNGATAANRVTDRSIRKFNPGTFQSDAEVIEQFAVRDGELAILLDVLQGNIHSPSCQHVLVVAPRGRGKTMLLARVAAELRTVDALSSYLLPVRFMEESHEIFNLADFWLDTLFHLASASAAHDPALARDLRDTHGALSGRWKEQTFEDRARAAVLTAADRLGRRLVLMVENMQALCQNVDDDFGWKLRQVLQSEPQIILLSSATSRFKGLDDVTQPFFELFRIIHLEPLATAECRRLWHAVTGEPVEGREVRPLEILTGGSPRLLVIVAGFAQHRSLRQLMEELVSLVDDHTEYFRNHLEVLSKVERRVYLAIIDLWQPSTPTEIAARARTDIRVVSTMLGRLANRGAIIAEGRGKRKLYSAAERLYSIYYKLRRERDEAVVVQNLIHFMVSFYSESQLFELSERLTLEAMESAVIRQGLDRVLAELRPFEDRLSTAVSVFKQVSDQATATYYRELQLRIDSAAKDNAFETIIDVANQALAAHDGDSPQLPAPLTAHILRRKADAYCRLGSWQAAIASFGEVVARFGDSKDPELQWRVTAALADKGDAHAELGDAQAAIATYDEAITRFGDVDSSNLQWPRAYASVRKGELYSGLNDWEAAITAYDEAVTRFGDSDDLHVQSWVASALVGSGDASAERGDSKAAIAAFDEVVARFGNSEDSHLQWRAATALGHKGDSLAKHGDPEAAIAVYDDVIARFGKSGDSHLRWQAATALVCKGDAYVKLGAPNVAIAAYDEVVSRFEVSDDSNLQWQVGTALLAKGRTFAMLGDLKTTIAVCDEIITRFGESNELDLQTRVAAALVNGGRARERLGEWEAAIATCDRLVSMYGDIDEPRLQRWVNWALADRGARQTDLGLGDEALHSAEELERRLRGLLPNDEEVMMKWRAMCVRTRALLVRRERQQAMDAFKGAYGVFLPSDDVMMHEMLQLVPDLVASGASERELVEILSSSSTKSGVLAPLVVALREHGGEEVRAPAEVRKVAADIREAIKARAAAAVGQQPIAD